MRSRSLVFSLALAASLGGCGPLTYITPDEMDARISSLDEDGDGVTKGQLDCNDLPDKGGEHQTPGAAEVPYDGWDNDCGGGGDQLDIDGDGFAGISQADWVALSHAAGWEGPDLNWPDNLDPNQVDCSDEEAAVYPGAVDAPYDGVDSDCLCDQDFDEDNDRFVADNYWAAHLVYLDGHVSCGLPVLSTGDCDDLDAAANEGVSVDLWYDGFDSNCSGNNDFDQDGDGVIPSGYDIPFNQFLARYDYSFLPVSGDCEDVQTVNGVSPSAVYPGAADPWYDGVDQNCAADNDYDRDLDGWIPAQHQSAFAAYRARWAPSLPTPRYGDCDDTVNAVHPEVLERFEDSVDQDCDGEANYTPWSYTVGGVTPTWGTPTRLVAGRDGAHYLITLKALAYQIVPYAGLSLYFDEDAGWGADGDEEVWQGTTNPTALAGGFDVTYDERGLAALIAYYRGAPYSKMLYKLYDLHWLGDYYSPYSSTYNQLTADLPVGADLIRSPDDGRVWAAACGASFVQMMAYSENSVGQVESTAVMGWASAPDIPSATSCVINLYTQDLWITDGTTISLVDFQEEMGTLDTGVPGMVLDLDWWMQESTTIARLDARDGWIFKLYQGTGGVSVMNTFGLEEYDFLSGTAVQQMDAVFDDLDGDGSLEVYLAAAVADQDGDGFRDIAVVHGNPYAPQVDYLPLTDATGAVYDVDEVTLWADQDRVFIAASGSLGTSDLVGWMFMGW